MIFNGKTAQTSLAWGAARQITTISDVQLSVIQAKWEEGTWGPFCPLSSGHLNACPAYYYTYNTQIRLKSSKTDPGVNSWRGTKLIQLGIHIKGVTPEKFSPLPSLAWLLAFMESFLTWLVCLRSFSLGENKTNYMADKPCELLRKC